MTEYWKSQARKYCEFCKCWMADNKVSISFHENGKKHKENVKKHISDLTKRSAKEFKQKEKLDDDIRKMEEAAMAAYAKDIQNNADLTSKVINEKLGNSTEVPQLSSSSSDSKPVWNEVRSNDGKTYFWNTQTNETTWDPPDSYTSLAQQEEEKIKEKEKEKAKHKAKKHKQTEAFKEANAHLAREKMRKLVKKEDKPQPTPMSFGPAPRAANPYGTWSTVVTQPIEQVDLQLPKSSKVVVPPPVIMEPEKIIEFKEKKVDSLGDGPVEFKKRKFNNPKRNMRQKLNDDDE